MLTADSRILGSFGEIPRINEKSVKYAHTVPSLSAASVQPRASIVKLARYPCTDPPGSHIGNGQFSQHRPQARAAQKIFNINIINFSYGFLKKKPRAQPGKMFNV